MDGAADPARPEYILSCNLKSSFHELLKGFGVF
jgi:hypothetical protein